MMGLNNSQKIVQSTPLVAQRPKRASSSSSLPKRSSSSSNGGRFVLSPKLLLSYIVIGAACFYSGIFVGAHTAIHTSESESSASAPMAIDSCKEQEDKMMDKIKRQEHRIKSLQEKLQKAKSDPQKEQPQARQAREESPAEDTQPRFPQGMQAYMGGLAAVDRLAFAKKFDVGVALDQNSKGNEQVLLLYAHPDAAPKSDPFKAAEATSNTKIPDLGEDVEMATENCDLLNLILTQPNERQQCFAFMGQYRSYHIQKFLRLPVDGGRLDRNVPLRLLNRGAQTSGRLSVKVPRKENTQDYWKTLTTYLQTLDATLETLKPFASKAASANKNNAVIVLVCNHGQSEILMNFVCVARARNVDLASVLVFATDEETRDLALGLGVNAFYDETNYGHIPKKAAGRYADRTFTAVMMAKVYCVQMTLMLDHDVLFLDVDIALYRNPLEFFHDEASGNYDIYFQDDGARGLFYAPYSANTGMYYIRNNDRTRYFINSLLLSGDLITATHSHQIALISLLNEHASLYNLKVKILSRDADEFPGGFTYHKRFDYMRNLFAGKVKPYLFHMSWTENKKNKQSFFKQMGNWYLEEKCVASTVEEITRKDKKIRRSNSHAYLAEPCCSKEPLVSCSYRDKPSVIPCKDSPPLDKGKKSFW
ncbi:Nucleotide-diphospho-sugar transferase [Seminavis robusta]|uniref:Nucleotide-diphospho-sugar transferase n=1 Tax=Seminavis robusta TaxID=568900 RepID=A0A9N8DBL8_9STRA|nr:Nucleotide-diphospho-sugar transferase [Seminavis robusta]|eukprot:Sro25_g016890.1 Nucleotide-diphospho-sugar transferase (649) ;mRNA; f:62022-64441